MVRVAVADWILGGFFAREMGDAQAESQGFQAIAA
jgi:hypothetical protein